KGVAAYSVAKAGVVQLTRALALELTFRGVRVNAIAPGFFATEINEEYLKDNVALTRSIPASRIGAMGDLDGGLLLLVPDARRVTAGTTVVVDGGQSVGLVGT